MLSMPESPNRRPAAAAKWYIIVLSTNDDYGRPSFYSYTTVAKDSKEAFERALKNIERTTPDLWELGKKNGFIKIFELALSREDVLKNFELEDDKDKPLAFKVVEEPVEVSAKSQLMQNIINSKDLFRLRVYRATGELTELEAAYVEDQIKL